MWETGKQERRLESGVASTLAPTHSLHARMIFQFDPTTAGSEVLEAAHTQGGLTSRKATSNSWTAPCLDHLSWRSLVVLAASTLHRHKT